MKFQLAPKQMAYLHEKVNWVLEVAPRNFNPLLIRTFAKMRWKFTPNAQYVDLGGRERSCLLEMLNFRLKDLGKTPLAYFERNLLEGLIMEFGGPPL